MRKVNTEIKWHNKKEVAAHFGIGKRTVTDWMRRRLNHEQIDEWMRNFVSHIGQDMTNGDLEYFELLPSESYDALADNLSAGYRRAVRAARHMPIINQAVIPSETVQTEVAPQN